MSKVKQLELCKTNKAKYDKFIQRTTKKYELDEETVDIINATFLDIIQKDSYALKECSEKAVLESYMFVFENKIKHGDEIDDYFWVDLKKKTRRKLAGYYTGKKTFDNNIDYYFNAVKAEYILHPYNESDELEFIPENYDVFVKNNLKLVIECAKRYQNLGLTFEDLIQAGNLGLLTALEKYDKNKANLRIKILKLLHESELETFTFEEASKLISNGFTYDKNLEQTLSKLPQDGFANKDDFEAWIYKNVKVASFASVAFMWIRAEIIIELNQVGSIIHVPQSAQKNGTSMANIIYLDSVNPHTDDCYHDNQISEVANEEFMIEDETIDNNERNSTFKELIEDLLYKLPDLERRIIKKRFGIDFPYQLSINEIAENEYLSTNKVKYILNNALKKINAMMPERDRELIIQMLN